MRRPKTGMISKHFRPVAPELHLARRGETIPEGSRRTILKTLFHALATAAFAVAVEAAPALAQQNYADQLTPTPDIEKVGGRYILMVLDQPDRDLADGRTKVNVLVDTKTGKTWILEYSRKPSSNEQGYVWSEIPFAKAPGE